MTTTFSVVSGLSSVWMVQGAMLTRTLAPADSPVSDCLRGRDQTKCDPPMLQVTGGLGNGLIILSHKRKLLREVRLVQQGGQGEAELCGFETKAARPLPT